MGDTARMTHGTAIRTRAVRQAVMAFAFLLFLAGAWAWPLLGYFIPVCMALGIGIALFAGRKWCDWACPRGSFLDAAVGRISRKRKIASFFKAPSTRIAGLFILMAIMAAQVAARWPDARAIGRFFVLMLIATTAIAIVFGILLHPRVWCYLCPVGSLSALIGRKKRPVMIDAARCTECGICGKACPMQIAPYAWKAAGAAAVEEGDCLRCGLCVAECPAQALERSPRKKA